MKMDDLKLSVEPSNLVQDRPFSSLRTIHFEGYSISFQSETEAFLFALDEWAKEHKKQSVTIEDMGDVVREMKLPHYWKEPLFRACGGTKGLSSF